MEVNGFRKMYMWLHWHNASQTHTKLPYTKSAHLPISQCCFPRHKVDVQGLRMTSFTASPAWTYNWICQRIQQGPSVWKAENLAFPWIAQCLSECTFMKIYGVENVLIGEDTCLNMQVDFGCNPQNVGMDFCIELLRIAPYKVQKLFNNFQ